MINDILKQREETYGEFSEVARVSQRIKSLIVKDDMDDFMKEGLEMIANKLARIACGDHTHQDNFVDIAGYSLLIYKELQNGPVW